MIANEMVFLFLSRYVFFPFLLFTSLQQRASCSRTHTHNYSTEAERITFFASSLSLSPSRVMISVVERNRASGSLIQNASFEASGHEAITTESASILSSYSRVNNTTMAHKKLQNHFETLALDRYCLSLSLSTLSPLFSSLLSLLPVLPIFSSSSYCSTFFIQV